jgi:hypothetical protein
MSRRHKTKQTAAKRTKVADTPEARKEATAPDWTRTCSNCGARPIVPVTGLCGPCTFGEADTIGGNW